MKTMILIGAALSLLACGGDVRTEGTEAGDCTDGVDNDGDGATDCDDTGCGAACGDAGARDGGGDPIDAGGQDAGSGDAGSGEAGVVIASCGASSGAAVSETTTGIVVDTRGRSNEVLACGLTVAPGNDGFVAFALSAGERWHFHAHSDSSVPGSDGRDPLVFLLSDVCDARDCDESSNHCAGPGDEHFTFDVPQTGRYYVGVDDHVAGGGAYALDAVRLLCGNGVREHGEACDGSVSCTAECRAILEAAQPSSEIEPNDSPSEANEILGLSAGGTFSVRGFLGGDRCSYPDVFTFVVDEGASLEIDAQTGAGVACANAAESPYELTLVTAAGEQRVAPASDANGCPTLSVAGLSAGRYFLRVEPTGDGEDVVAYGFELTVAL